MRLPRWIHQLYAWVNGYYWLPCPRCGRWTGGHEGGCSRDPCAVMVDATSGQIVCQDCCQGAEAHEAAADALHSALVRSLLAEGVLQVKDLVTGQILTPMEAARVLKALPGVDDDG